MVFEYEELDVCPLCGSRDHKQVGGAAWKGAPFSYAICMNCDLKFMNPRPTEASYKSFYEDDYWQDNLESEGFYSSEDYADASVDQLELRRAKYERVYQEVVEQLEADGKLGPDCSILEVGCAFGYTLEWLKQNHQMSVFGIEPSSTAVERCSAGGVDIIAGVAEALRDSDQLPGAPFDVVLFRHALDPLVEPIGVLQGARRWLKPNGRLLIHCVNAYYQDAMDPYHPWLYTPSSLRRLVQQCGFRVVRHQFAPVLRSLDDVANCTSPSYQQIISAEPAQGELDLFVEEHQDLTSRLRSYRFGKMAMALKEIGMKRLAQRVGVMTASRVGDELRKLTRG